MMSVFGVSRVAGSQRLAGSSVAVLITALFLHIFSHLVDCRPVGPEEVNAKPDPRTGVPFADKLADGCIVPHRASLEHFYGKKYVKKAIRSGLLEDGPDTEARGIIPETDRLWRNNLDSADGLYIVPIEFDAYNSFSSYQQENIRQWLEGVGTQTAVIKVVQRSSESDYIRITSASDGCWSYVGRLGQGEQQLNLDPSGCVYKGTAQHELLHALGFLHEQSRPDRDTYVTINFQNIPEKNAHNFETSDSIKSMGSPYDYSSVMHYGAYAFSINDQPTIQAPEPIGMREGLSPGDIEQVRMLYQCYTGPRGWTEYTAARCTAECQCGLGMTGCSSDAHCKPSLSCVNSTCTIGKLPGIIHLRPPVTSCPGYAFSFSKRSIAQQLSPPPSI